MNVSSSLEGKLDSKVQDVTLTYVALLIRISDEEYFCTGFVLTELHVITTGHCTKPYELNDESTSSQRLPHIPQIYVLIEDKRQDVYMIQSHPCYKSNPKSDFSFDIGIITVSRLTRFERCYDRINL